MLRSVPLSLVLTAAIAGPALAEESEVHYTLELSSVTSYVYRGDRVSSDLMRPTLQPSAELQFTSVGPGTLTAGLWTSGTLGDVSMASEIDPYVGYSVPLGAVALDVSYTLFLLPDAAQLDAMHEIILQASTQLSSPVQFYLGLGVDPIRTEGWYAFGGATTAFDAGPIALEATLNVGGSDYAALTASLQDITLSARGSYAFDDSGLYVAATAAAAWSGRSEQLLPYAGLAFGFHR